MTEPPAQVKGLGRFRGVALALLAAAGFQASWEVPELGCLVLVYAFCLIHLSRVEWARVAFRLGFLAGMLVFGPQLAWFWRIFGVGSVCLWAVLSLFTGFFVLALYFWRKCVGARFLWVAAPVFWMGLEYFRGELYFLRFSWLSAGYVFSGRAGILPIGIAGVYGCGFLIFLLAGVAAQFTGKRAALFLCVTVVLTGGLASIPKKGTSSLLEPARRLNCAGIQLEFPPDLEVPRYLDEVVRCYPNAELLVLSEYTFDGEIPRRVREWCRQHEKYLVAGGKAPAQKPGEFYNTAFVVGPDGEIVFQQVKSVPIQFFKDGLPAPDQKLWDSPWGKLAICVCYDMSYRAVMDDFIRQGAQALIVPFMDVTEWGRQQHELHAKIGSIRAQEYRIPIFRVGSSGISQMIDRSGHVISSASFPGQEEMIGGVLLIGAKGRVPLDHWAAPACSAATGAYLLWLCLRPMRKSLSQKKALAHSSGP